VTERPAYSVSDLIRQINLDLYRYSDVAVEGEVSNFVRSSAGHLYFSLKDAKAQIRVVLFASNARFLKFRIENGLKLIVRGRLAIYEAKGDFQMNAVSVEPAGLGALQLAFEQLKQQLAAEGLFDAARKKPMPSLPQKLAIVTSPTGAAIRDVLHVLARRFQGLHIQIYPVRVQGPTAGKEIAAAIKHLSRWDEHDVIIVCRGGGSLEDLWAFNEEVVARAIAASPIPIISGVGHETDFTIADFVSDLRAPTPSAAAEIVIRAKSELCSAVDNASDRIRRHIEKQVRQYRADLRHFASSDGLGRALRRARDMRAALDRRRVALDRLLRRQAEVLRVRVTRADNALARVPAKLGLSVKHQRVISLHEKLVWSMRNRIATRRDNLASRVGTLEAVSPLSVLSRGYAIAFSLRGGKRRPLFESMAVNIGEQIEVQLRKGRLECTVDRHSMGLETIWPAEIKRDLRDANEDETKSE
jgi:exodeoxyribonuclease VII large subunit